MNEPRQVIKCRICRKYQYVTIGRCSSCGTPVANAIDHSKPPRKKPACPRCQSNRNYEVEPGRFACGACGEHFELDDFGFLDTRPLENLEKKERLEANRKKKRKGKR